ncbi:hypothetical protein B296_00055570 [Ensete ventricosum]|uniref:Uncharacterized protein n=1 Tax=Ensete ventricosum TaxID=4639 RepID=A0A426XZ20_ENSVE|nr:hypothetical protein B296_00055570 [Ensete ventricosum]
MRHGGSNISAMVSYSELKTKPKPNAKLAAPTKPQAKPTAIVAKSKGKPKALVPVKPKTKPKPKSTIVRPKGVATRPMLKVTTRSTKIANTSTKEKRWSLVRLGIGGRAPILAAQVYVKALPGREVEEGDSNGREDVRS